MSNLQRRRAHKKAISAGLIFPPAQPADEPKCWNCGALELYPRWPRIRFLNGPTLLCCEICRPPEYNAERDGTYSLADAPMITNPLKKPEPDSNPYSAWRPGQMGWDTADRLKEEF